MVKYIPFVMLIALSGCKTPAPPAAIPESCTRIEELVVKINKTAPYEKNGDYHVSLHPRKTVLEGDKTVEEKNETIMGIVVKAGQWAQINASATVIGYTAFTECLMGEEVAKVSGMPGKNFTVKVEPAGEGRFHARGILLTSKHGESGEIGETIPFDFMAELGSETTVYRKTTIFDPAARIGEERLLRDDS
ncbi:hypothetical protein PDESU_00745 [Pontiella desulfatans]|uniref:Uncharacterized protein n=1 Tax=Pontiella desulfatans TaxID=2750659 RepID=A0A6C2TXE3_PONDE|nr:hypothetical protein [Pontiella desulfatans]VGO12194.1 hypothetical protein PDESU_00745 [Pontiella desulfatans]